MCFVAAFHYFSVLFDIQYNPTTALQMHQSTNNAHQYDLPGNMYVLVYLVMEYTMLQW